MVVSPRQETKLKTLPAQEGAELNFGRVEPHDPMGHPNEDVEHVVGFTGVML